MKDSYDDFFYQQQLIDSKKSAKEILPIIENWFAPKSIVDVGCGVGAWLSEWKEIGGNKDVLGYDSDLVADSLLLLEPDEFVKTDLNNRVNADKKFDLAMCLEVAEHLDEKRAATFVNDLTSLSDVVLFSAAIPGQEGTHHVNEQFLDYWVNLFNQNEYECYDVLRPKIWNNDNILWWYKQNIVIFIKKGNKKSEVINSFPSFYCFDLVRKEIFFHKSKKLANANEQITKTLSNPFFYLKSIIIGLKNRLR